MCACLQFMGHLRNRAGWSGGGRVVVQCLSVGSVGDEDRDVPYVPMRRGTFCGLQQVASGQLLQCGR